MYLAVLRPSYSARALVFVAIWAFLQDKWDLSSLTRLDPEPCIVGWLLTREPPAKSQMPLISALTFLIVVYFLSSSVGCGFCALRKRV